MKRTRNGILIPDVPIMKPHNLPTVVKGYNSDNDMAVDMGLRSGLLWAKCDIDVTQPRGFAVTPFTYVKSFFSWGNIVGHNPISNSLFGYNWGGVNAAEPWYEGQPYGDTPGNTLSSDIPVGKEFDAARANLGELWRTPTLNEFAELFDGCIHIDANGVEIPAATSNKLVTINNIVGIYLQSKTNGNRLFFAASGNGDGLSWVSRGEYGTYRSRTFISSRDAHSLLFSRSGVYPNATTTRFHGFAIRPVMNSR